ncbi:cardiolipin synthase [Metapseudomonas furukawaii]|uniref:cardiolipin synthase n=1 Tax=Metapseudomonas furukawaii TaxID=1149133 RepID=UPI00404658E1
MSRPSPGTVARVLVALYSALLLACTPLPRINPDLVHSPAPVQLDGAHGPLSEARSRAILERLKAGGPETDFLDLHLAIEEALVGSPLTAGNRVELLQDGPATYAAMFAAIEGARDHINMETYILEGDEVGERFATALIAKQRGGVQVNLIYDSVGTLTTPPAFFARLAQAGIRLVEFNPINPLTAKAGWQLNQRDHRKLLIVDGRVAILGGVNISGVYSGGSFGSHGVHQDKDRLPWRDTDLRIEGPVVADLQKLFIETWDRQKGGELVARHYFPPLQPAGDEVVRAIGSSPEEPYSQIYATLISALHSAQSEIWLTAAYFVPDPQLLDALESAAARGVDVRLVVPSRTDSWLVFHAGRAYYRTLLEAGVRLYERHDALLHVKAGVIDGVWSTVGSTNLDWRSFLHNQEVNVVVLGADFGQRMRKAFLDDVAASEEITLERWQSRSIRARISERIGRIWEYWL